jgi:outer membrane protein assembly factor BamD
MLVTVRAMNRWFFRLALGLLVLLALPRETPAPLVYRQGEGWSYEAVGGTKWTRNRAKDQLDVAQAAYDEQNYRLAIKAARRTVRTWPLSDFAPQAQYLLARSYDAQGRDDRAFKEYQILLEKYPKVDTYQEVVQRQYEIANRFLAGKWFRLWGYIPLFSSMDRTADMYEKVIRSGVYSDIAPSAQLKIGEAREKQKDFPLAVKAYERAADRYHDKPVAADALFRAGKAYQKQAKGAEYDQSIAGKAIGTFSDFSVLYPDDPRVAEAQKIIEELRTEQARGSFQTARFYEKNKKWDGALVYYNEVLVQDANSSYAQEAKERIDAIKQKQRTQTAAR